MNYETSLSEELEQVSGQPRDTAAKELEHQVLNKIKAMTTDFIREIGESAKQVALTNNVLKLETIPRYVISISHH